MNVNIFYVTHHGTDSDLELSFVRVSHKKPLGRKQIMNEPEVLRKLTPEVDLIFFT